MTIKIDNELPIMNECLKKNWENKHLIFKKILHLQTFFWCFGNFAFFNSQKTPFTKSYVVLRFKTQSVRRSCINQISFVGNKTKDLRAKFYYSF